MSIAQTPPIEISSAEPSRHAGRIGALIELRPWLLPALACLAVVVTRALIPTCVDVSVLITWAERLLDGARPYVDFVEINPPGSILIYTPGVALARGLGLRPELGVEVVHLALIALSLWLCSRILEVGRQLDGHRKPLLLAAAIVILGVMPSDTFAQREHVGIVAMLPLLCIAMVEIAGGRAAVGMKLAAGLLGGLSLIAKPHFALILAVVWLAVIIVRRRVGPAFGSHWIVAGAVFAAYVAATWFAYPEFYTEALPRIADVYLGWYASPARMLLTPVLPLAGISALLLYRLHRTRGLAQPTGVALACALIAVAVFYLQGRAWPYQALPALTLLGLALAWEVTSTETSWQHARDLVAVAVAVPLLSFAWMMDRQERRIDRIVTAVVEAHPRPRMLAIAEDISIGHPLVRRVDGVWAHSVTHLWAAYGALSQLEGSSVSTVKRIRLEANLAAEISGLARAIDGGRPDVIVAQIGWADRDEMDWLAWARQHPALAAALREYSPVARIDDVEILRRIDIAADATPRGPSRAR